MIIVTIVLFLIIDPVHIVIHQIILYRQLYLILLLVIILPYEMKEDMNDINRRRNSSNSFDSRMYINRRRNSSNSSDIITPSNS